MAAITPSTNLYLLKNSLNISKQNQLTFATATAQYNYFISLPKLEVENFTYQRKDYIIRYPACIDDILEYNYCMYQNDAYDEKWFYAYIKNMRYINDNMTEITIETDVYQTFMFDMLLKPSFVEREHVADDTIGKHTVPEGLETGEYICTGYTSDNFAGAHPVLAVTQYCKDTNGSGFDMQDDNRLASGGSMINGIYQGCAFILCATDQTSSNTVTAMLGNYALAGKSDSIVGLFMVPDVMTGYSTIQWDWMEPSGGLLYNAYKVLKDINISLGEKSFNKPTGSIGTYSPKNNKVFAYPYRYLLVSNNNGGSAIYQYELFSTTQVKFKKYGTITPGCSIRIVPLNYKGKSEMEEEGLNLGKYPICSYNCDMYTNWLTQNGVNIAGVKLNAYEAGILGGVTSAAVGLGAIASGNPYGIAQVGAGIGEVMGAVQENYRHSLIPPQAQGNLNCGDVIFSSGNCNFIYYQMSIKEEYAKIIDGYFQMYGYKVNTIKIPETDSRTYWNYVKCIGANIEGTIPEFYLDELRAMFNAGITLWHDAGNFLDYSLTNSIVS